LKKENKELKSPLIYQRDKEKKSIDDDLKKALRN
jgi:hypothetical protein